MMSETTTLDGRLEVRSFDALLRHGLPFRQHELRRRTLISSQSVVDAVVPMVVGLERSEDQETDEELVGLARVGDKRAFRILVDRHQSTLARTIVGMIGDRGSVDDVLQDVFIQFYNTLENYRGDASVRTYLNRIAVNKSLDLLRRRTRWHKRFLSRDETPVLEVSKDTDTADRNDVKRLVWNAINLLPDSQRSVVVLRMIEGFSTEETAELLSIEYGTVLSRLSRGMGKLRSTLGPLFDEVGRTEKKPTR